MAKSWKIMTHVFSNSIKIEFIATNFRSKSFGAAPDRLTRLHTVTAQKYPYSFRRKMKEERLLMDLKMKSRPFQFFSLVR